MKMQFCEICRRCIAKRVAGNGADSNDNDIKYVSGQKSLCRAGVKIRLAF